MTPATHHVVACAVLVATAMGISGCNFLEAKLHRPGRPVFLSAAWRVKKEQQEAEARRVAEREYLEYFAQLMARQHPNLHD